MSRERFQEPGGRILPISKKAIEGAFPYSTNKESVEKALREEAIAMSSDNQDLFMHTKSLRTAYPGNPNVAFSTFSDGIRFMHRILRYQTTLPVLSPQLLSVYDLEHNRGITDRGKGMKEYFVDKWMTEFQGKREHTELTKVFERVGGIHTNRIEEIWGGAYYVTKAFEKQVHVNEANNIYPLEIKEMKKRVPEFFRDRT